MTDIEPNKRFIRLIEYFGFSDVNKNNKLDKSGFAKYIGVHQTTIGDITLNRTGIGTKVLMALSAKNPDININWILTGEGDMINQKTTLTPEKQPETIKISGKAFRLPEGEKCPTCERLKWKMSDMEKDLAGLREENKKLVEENAVLRYLADGEKKTTG